MPITLFNAISKRVPWRLRHASVQISLARSLILLFVLATLAGCKPKPVATPAPASAVAEATNVDGPPVAQAAVAASPSALPVIASDNGQPDLGALSHSVLRWAVAHQRRPASFEEFAADPRVQIPPPPPGKKYKMEHSLHVVLVNQ